MSRSSVFPLVAVDVGNSRMKLGVFERAPVESFPETAQAVVVPLDASAEAMIDWLPRAAIEYRWAMSSVNRPPTARLTEALASRGVQEARLLAHGDLPLAIDLPEPARVGMDRLCNALAVRELRGKHGPAIVISVGSAITVDLVTASGSFAGGAILPGLEMSAHALHEFTDLLPHVTLSEPAAPSGRSTIEAIQFGLYWGAIGAIGELARRLDPEGMAEVFITGGGAQVLMANLHFGGGKPPRLVPHLTLAGIALAMLKSPTSRLS
jgi:type III pantothenate kinase